MKNVCFLAVSLLLCGQVVHAQCPSDGTVFLTDQAAVDDYVANYGTCTTLTGDLSIANLDDLSFLTSLVSVGGFLHITSCENLTSLDGLQNLEAIGGGLRLANLPALQNLDDLGGLTAIPGDVELENAPLLSSLNGLNGVTTIGGDLLVTNLGISNLQGLGNLASLGGTLAFQSMPNLQHLNDLTGLTTIPGNLSIDDNNELTDLSGLANITFVGGDLSINNSPVLPQLTGLGSINTVGGALSVYNNPLLTDLDALAGLQSLGNDLALGNLPLITNLNGLANIASLEQMVVIVNNPLLTLCAISPVCAKLAADGNASFIVFNNATGCADTDEIEAACLAMPVTLVNFTAGKAEEGVLLRWSTTMEANSARFEIQRSENAKDWRFAGMVQAQGESQTIISYSFNDRQLPYGQRFYRLKMVDLDGSYAYSAIVSISITSDNALLFPNPATETVNIRTGVLGTITQVNVSDLAGRSVYTANTVGTSVPLNGLAAGIYLITITHDGGKLYQGRIVVGE